jgi:succinylglutamic semialdehyde dehydrogenase
VERVKVAEDGPFLPRGDYIGGRFEPPATPTGEIPLEDPGDTTALHGAFPFSTAALDAAVEAARRAYPAWRDVPARERNALLSGLADRIREGRERLALVIAQEAGKPVWEARTEVDAMVGKVAITLEEGLGLVGDRSLELSPTMVGRWRAHPRGVLAVLGPFNFPGHLLHGWVVPALACGNTIVAKPSERTPSTGQLYAELVAEAGLPPGVFNLVQGDGDQGARLVAHPEVDGVLFTGSWRVGRRILQATLDQPGKLVALEMGGKNACLVCEDADLDAAVYHAAFGAAVTAGQRCSSTSRIIVHPSVSSSFTERLRNALSGVTLGYPLDEGVFLGPVISAAARQRHTELHRWAREEGAETLLEGGPCEGPGRDTTSDRACTASRACGATAATSRRSTSCRTWRCWSATRSRSRSTRSTPRTTASSRVSSRATEGVSKKSIGGHVWGF